MGKKNQVEQQGPQQVFMSWADQDMHDVLVHQSLYLVTAQITQLCITTGKTPEEVMDIYSKTYELVEDWHRGGPLKEQVKKMIDTLLPTAPGMKPGETLLPKVTEAPYMEEAKKAYQGWVTGK